MSVLASVGLLFAALPQFKGQIVHFQFQVLKVETELRDRRACCTSIIKMLMFDKTKSYDLRNRAAELDEKKIKFLLMEKMK